MPLTPAIEVGHWRDNPGEPAVYHYRMAPGVALLVSPTDAPLGEVKISKAEAKRAVDVSIFRWHAGKPVVEFRLDGKTLLQPMPIDLSKPKPQRKSKIPSARPDEPKPDKPKRARAGLL